MYVYAHSPSELYYLAFFAIVLIAITVPFLLRRYDQFGVAKKAWLRRLYSPLARGPVPDSELFQMLPYPERRARQILNTLARQGFVSFTDHRASGHSVLSTEEGDGWYRRRMPI